MRAESLQGVIAPIVTPLTEDERVDSDSLRRLVEFVLDGGVTGVWVTGTIGECMTLTEVERAKAVEVVAQQVNGRVPVIANIGDSSTQLALRHAAAASTAGADVLASTPPHFYVHTMDEVVDHFRALKSAYPELPLLIYNIPALVKVKMTIDATIELANEGVASGIKDSQNDLEWFRDMRREVGARKLDHGFACLLGTRSLIDVASAVGADGVVPADANLAPQACVRAFEGRSNGQWEDAQKAQDELLMYRMLRTSVRTGSPHAATIGVLKCVLKEWGIIADATMSRPLRRLSLGEIAEIGRRAALLRVPSSAVAS